MREQLDSRRLEQKNSRITHEVEEPLGLRGENTSFESAKGRADENQGTEAHLSGSVSDSICPRASTSSHTSDGSSRRGIELQNKDADASVFDSKLEREEKKKTYGEEHLDTSLS